MLGSRYAMWMAWGLELTFLCDGAYPPTVGTKRDWVLGARSDRVREGIWPDIGPRIERVLSTGESTWDESLLLFLARIRREARWRDLVDRMQEGCFIGEIVEALGAARPIAATSRSMPWWSA